MLSRLSLLTQNSGGFADAKRYDLGCYENFKQVFGKSPLLWVLPVPSTVGNGYEFETRSYISTDVPNPAAP